MTKERKNWAVWTSIAPIMVFAAAFMPWGEITATPAASFGGSAASDFFGSSPFGGMTMTLTVNGWNGTFTLAGIKFPNWTVVLLAGSVTALAWLAATGAWRPPRYLGPALAAIGLLQAVLTLLVFVGSKESSVGLGILATIVGLAALTFASFALATERSPAAS